MHIRFVLMLRRQRAYDFKANMIQYKGAALALTDVLGGQTDFYSGNLSEVPPYAKSERLRPLSFSSECRIPQVPEVPPIAEIFPGHSVKTWNGILEPSGVQAFVIDELAREMTKIPVDKKFQDKLQAIVITPIPEIKDALRRRTVDDVSKCKPVSVNAGIKPI